MVMVPVEVTLLEPLQRHPLSLEGIAFASTVGDTFSREICAPLRLPQEWI